MASVIERAYGMGTFPLQPVSQQDVVGEVNLDSFHRMKDNLMNTYNTSTKNMHYNDTKHI